MAVSIKGEEANYATRPGGLQSIFYANHAQIKTPSIEGAK